MDTRVDDGNGVVDDRDTIIKGASDFEECLKVLSTLDLLRAKAAECKPAPPCPLNGVNLPPMAGDFVAVSEFWSVCALTGGAHLSAPDGCRAG